MKKAELIRELDKYPDDAVILVMDVYSHWQRVKKIQPHVYNTTKDSKDEKTELMLCY